MKYPIVQVKTADNLWLHGFFLKASESKTVFINIHGTASNFYEEYFIEMMTEKFLEAGISMLSTNNRGAGVYDAYQGTGAATEIFEDSLIDIDTWINFALEEGFKSIILSGHSLGTEKVVYYMNNGKYVDKITAIVLLAPADSYGSHRILDGKDNTRIRKNIEQFLKESGDLINRGHGEDFLPRDTYGSHSGIVPKTPKSLVNFLGPNSKLLEALPIATGKLNEYGKIKVPILVAIGDQQEYTALTIKDTLDLMKKENRLTEITQLKNCDHDFQGCEEQLANLVLSFIQKYAK
jgi:hypothetical protein